MTDDEIYRLFDILGKKQGLKGGALNPFINFECTCAKPAQVVMEGDVRVVKNVRVCSDAGATIWSCLGCGAAFYASEKNIHDLKQVKFFK